jgi:hypothetical protein
MSDTETFHLSGITKSVHASTAINSSLSRYQWIFACETNEIISKFFVTSQMFFTNTFSLEDSTLQDFPMTSRFNSINITLTSTRQRRELNQYVYRCSHNSRPQKHKISWFASTFSYTTFQVILRRKIISTCLTHPAIHSLEIKTIFSRQIS